MEDEDMHKLIDMVRQIAETVVRQGHQLEELRHRVGELELHDRSEGPNEIML